MYYPNLYTKYQRYVDKCIEQGIEPLSYDDWLDEMIDRSDRD